MDHQDPNHEVDHEAQLPTNLSLGRQSQGFKSSITVAVARIACERQRECVRLKLQVLEARHLDTITSMVQLTSDWFHQGRNREREPLAAQIVQFGREILGDLHPDTLKAMYELARTLLECGRYQESEALAK